MNLGQYLTQYSPLPSGTVAQHLAAIAGRIGTGQGTVFCSQFIATVERPELVITRKAKRSAAPEPAAVVRAPTIDKQQKHITAFRFEPRMSVFFEGPDEITAQQRTVSVSVQHRLDSKTTTRTPKRF